MLDLIEGINYRLSLPWRVVPESPLLFRDAKNLHNAGFIRGAHHPHCDRHHNHLIWIRGRPLCLGCTCMYAGIILGIPLVFLVDWTGMSFRNWITLHALLLIPTAFQPRIQLKACKIVSRFFLGIAVPLYLISGLFLLTPPIHLWLFRGFVIVMFLAVYRILKWLRYTRRPCDNCPLGYFPICEWNLTRLIAGNDDELVEALLSDKLQNLIVR